MYYKTHLIDAVNDAITIGIAGTAKDIVIEVSRITVNVHGVYLGVRIMNVELAVDRPIAHIDAVKDAVLSYLDKGARYEEKGRKGNG